jgi:uncharacterized protein
MEGNRLVHTQHQEEKFMTVRKGNYITTFTGVKFYPMDPRLEDYVLEDIAHALSQVNRANGHTILPMSVAQHAVNVATILKQLGYSVRTQFIGLNHDDSEAYIADLPSPVKEWLPDYAKIEKTIQDMAYEWCGLGKVTDEEYEPVHIVDKALFPVEARFTLPHANHPVDPMLEDMIIIPWTPERAKAEFIKLWYELRDALLEEEYVKTEAD